MKNVVAALLLTLSAPVFAGCYDFNATQAQYDALNGINQPVRKPNVVGQAMDFNIAVTGPDPLAAVFYQALSANGADALYTALLTDQPQGDILLPTSGLVQVQFQVDSFIWREFEFPGSTAGLSFLVSTGNEGTLAPRQKLESAVFLTNSRNFNQQGNPSFLLTVKANTTDGEDARRNTLHFPFNLGDPVGNTAGFEFDMSNGRTVWFTANGVRVNQMKDQTTNLPLVIPPGVSKVFLSVGGYYQGILDGEDALETPLIKATLLTNVCSNTTPERLLPNGKPFKGNGHAYGIFGKPE